MTSCMLFTIMTHARVSQNMNGNSGASTLAILAHFYLHTPLHTIPRITLIQVMHAFNCLNYLIKM